MKDQKRRTHLVREGSRDLFCLDNFSSNVIWAVGQTGPLLFCLWFLFQLMEAVVGTISGTTGREIHCRTKRERERAREIDVHLEGGGGRSWARLHSLNWQTPDVLYTPETLFLFPLFIKYARRRATGKPSPERTKARRKEIEG